MSQSALDPLTVLSACEEIKQLKSRYFHGVDEKDWELLEDTFTEDVVLDFSEEGQHHAGHHGVQADEIVPEEWIVTGAATGTRLIESIVAELVTVHQGHDPQITLTGPDTATGTWSMYDCLDYGSEVFHGYGYYHEAYRRVDGRWKIERLKLTRLRVEWR